MSSITPLRDERTLVLQLRDAIGALIDEQGLKPGDQLPTEAELTRRFQISRPALREALKLLEQGGAIYVRHGKGRFVSAAAALQVERPITCFESVSEMMQKSGYRPINKVLSISEEAASEEVKAALRLDADDRVIRLERLRMQGDEVLVYCLDYIPRTAVPGRLYDTDWSGSLLDLLERHGMRPRMSTAVAASVMLPSDVRERNDLHDFGPAFLIVETAFTQAGVPILYAKDYHRGNRFSFSFVRK